MAKQQTEMLTHDQIWGAMDRLAERSGLSPSGLAKASGLDPTTFNKSKRITPEGRPRWPSTESVAKALTAETGQRVAAGVALEDVVAGGARERYASCQRMNSEPIGGAVRSGNDPKDRTVNASGRNASRENGL